LIENEMVKFLIIKSSNEFCNTFTVEFLMDMSRYFNDKELKTKVKIFADDLLFQNKT
jgi:hypothetical protein